MTKSRVFLILSLSFIIGIFTASFNYPRIINYLWLYFLIILALIGIAVFYKNKIIVAAGCAVLFFVLGAFLTSVKLNVIKGLDKDGNNFSGNVTVVNEPQISGQAQKLIVQTLEDTNLKEKLLVNAGVYPEYYYGDKLNISCQLKIPSVSQSAETFDYKMYLAKDGVFYECQKPKIENLNSNSGNKSYAALLGLKNKFEKNIYALIPAPESGLLVGLILGGSQQLSKEVQNNFSRTGLTHIIAVSGYNVTIIANCLMIAGIWLGLWRPKAFWFAATGIILFVIATGMSASAVRAGVMGILLIWAVKNGRLANSRNAILFAAGMMLIFNPLLLRWDIGFQMSFLATLGIIYLYPIFQNYFLKLAIKKDRIISAGTEILLLTLSAQIFVLPVILYNFNQLSLISPLANVLILPIIPFTMLLGFIAAALGFIFGPLAQIFSWLAYLPLKYETTMINFLSSLKYASVEMKLSWLAVVLWYIMLVAAIKWQKDKIMRSEIK